MVINKKWLDKLGMDIPTTGDELYEVLCAFRDNDVNENGDTNDEIPMEFSESNWAAKIMNIANFFGIAGGGSSNVEAYLMVKDGKVVPTADTEEFRAFLEYAHKLAEEGLLDVEGFSQTNEQYYQKLKEHVVGCYWAWTPLSNIILYELFSESVSGGNLKTGSDFPAGSCGRAAKTGGGIFCYRCAEFPDSLYPEWQPE